VPVGIGFGIALIAAFILVFLRLPLYLLWELPRCITLSESARQHPDQARLLWYKQPLHYDECIRLPLKGLPEHLSAIAKADAGGLIATTRDVCEQALRTQVKRLQTQRIELGHRDRAQLRDYANILAQWQSLLEQEANIVAQQRRTAGELPMRYSAGAVLQPGD